MNEKMDKVSSVSLRIIDALLIRNPERTAIGGVLGFAFLGILELLRPAFELKGIVLGPLAWWTSVSLGVAVVHLPFIFWSVRNKPLINDAVEGLIQLIEATNLSAAEKRVLYRQLVNRCISDFSVSSSGNDLERLAEVEKDMIERKLRITD